MLSYLPLSLHIFSSILAISLALRIFIKNPDSPVNRSFALIMFCSCIWSLGDIMVENPSVPLHTAWLGKSISTLGWSTAAPALFIFFLEFSEWKGALPKRYLYPSLFIIPAVIIYQQWNNSFFSFTHEFYGWGLIWPNTYTAYAFYAFIFIILISCINLMNSVLQNEKNPVRLGQAKFIVINSYFVFTFVFIFSIVMPILEMNAFPVIGDTLVSVWGAWQFFGGKKHGLFTAQPF